MRRYFFLFLIAIGLSLQAQYFTKGKDWNFSRIYRPWGITLSGNFYPFGYENQPRTFDMMRRTYLMWGFSAGLSLNWNWNNRWGMKFRLLTERTPVYSYRLHIPAQATNENKDLYQITGTHYAPLSFHLQIGPEARSFLIENYVLFLGGGIDLSYSMGFNESRKHNKYFNTVFVNQPGFRYGFYIQAGWYYRFPWALWETAIVYRSNLSGYYEGFYMADFSGTSNNEQGKIFQPADYIALQFTWYFRKKFVGDGANCPGEVDSPKVKKRRKKQQKAREKARKRNEKMRKKLMRNKRKEQKEKNKRKRRKKKFLGLF